MAVTVATTAIVVFDNLRRNIWMARVDHDAKESRMLDADQYTIPSIRFKADAQDTSVEELFTSVFGFEPRPDGLHWLEKLQHKFEYGNDNENCEEHTVYVYECTTDEVKRIKDTTEFPGYRKAEWVYVRDILNCPYDSDMAPYQPIWLLRNWVWFGQRVLFMIESYQRMGWDKERQ